MFCICTPFGPPSLLEMPQKEVMFKSKHKLDLGNVSFEQRGKDLFGYNETEFSSKGIYDLVHPEDLSYVAQAHSECKYKCKSWDGEKNIRVFILQTLKPTYPEALLSAWQSLRNKFPKVL